MPGWKEFLVKLADQVNKPLLAFGLLALIIIALLGNRVASNFQALFNIVAILVIVGDIAISILTIVFREKSIEPSDYETPSDDTISKQDVDSEFGSEGKPKEGDIRSYSTKSLDHYREDYLNKIVADCKKARLVGVDPQAADPTRGAFSLERLFITLDTKSTLKEKLPVKSPLPDKPPSASDDIITDE